jgi:hypothetical protein
MFKQDNPAGSLFCVMFEHGLRGFTHWGEYFDKYGIKEPTDVRNNPFTFGWGHPELDVWEVVALDSERARNFAAGMKCMDSISSKYGGPASVYNFEWIGNEAAFGKNIDRALIVDVGGNHGATLKHIMAKVPAIPQDRCVLQDRPEVIEESILAGDPALRDISRMAHDFNLEQPIKGKPNSTTILWVLCHKISD